MITRVRCKQCKRQIVAGSTIQERGWGPAVWSQIWHHFQIFHGLTGRRPYPKVVSFKRASKSSV